MPVLDNYLPNSHTGNGVTTVFAYSWRILASTDLAVTVGGVATSAYTVAGVGSPAGGTITFTVAPASGAAIVISRARPFARSIDYQENGDLLAQTVDDDIDSDVMLIQQVRDMAKRAIKLPVGVTTDQILSTGSTTAERADKVLGFDTAGNPTLHAPVDNTLLSTDLASTANGKGASLIGRGVQFLESFTALRALLKTSASQYAFVKNVGHYRLDIADTTSPDTGGTVIVATDGGRWKRLHEVVTSGHFYDEFGSLIGRFGDRLLVGDAVKNGANTASQPDWLTTWQLAKGRSFGFIQSTQAAILNGLGAELVGAQNAFLAGAQTSNLTAGFNAVGILGVAVANKTSGVGNAYAGYYEAFRGAGAPGGAYGIEIDTVNYQAASATNPYAQAADQVIGLQIAAGAELSPTGQFSAAAAINIRKNGSTFDRALVVGSDALSGCDGVTGTAVAIGLAKGHQVQWYAAGDVLTSSIECVGTTVAGGSKQRIGNGFVNWLNDANVPVMQIAWPASAVNYPSARASAAGNAVQYVAEGSDTDVDIQLVPKGTGKVWVGAWTSNADAAVNGYVTVKDSSGNVRKLATIA